MKALPLLLLIFLLPSCESEDTPDPSAPVVLTRGDLQITVLPDYGGRVSSLQFRGEEILNTVRDTAGFQFGSTAWASPQEPWGWPPSATLDSEPYTVVEVDSHSVIVSSATDPETALQLKKRIRLGPDTDVGLTYWLTNRSDSTMDLAVWENTRLPYAGHYVFGADSVRITDGMKDPVELTEDSLQTIILNGRHPKNGKVFADITSEYVSYFTPSGPELRKYTAITDLYETAEGQAPLEIYLAPEAGFTEFELQGGVRRVGFGEVAVLRTRWAVREAK